MAAKTNGGENGVWLQRIRGGRSEMALCSWRRSWQSAAGENIIAVSICSISGGEDGENIEKRNENA
jgi:hypothetical protein